MPSPRSSLDARAAWRAAGAGSLHERWLARAWLAGRSLDGLADEELAPRHLPLPARLRTELPRLSRELEAGARVVSRHPSADGSARLLIELADGARVESVLLARDGVCLSTQVGCAVGCRFCKTGEAGLLRQLSADEILAQFALANRERASVGSPPLRRAVLMGMGEPSHNLAAVLDAISALANFGGLGHKNMVFSTVGDLRAFAALHAHAVRPALALSLHSMDDARRRDLLPRAPRIAVDELIDASLGYADASGHPLQVQWTLLAGLNDGEDELEALGRRFAGRRAILNVIPWNHVDSAPFARPALDAAIAFVRGAKRRGLFSTLRRSAGADVDGACGQLRSRLAAVAPD